MSAGDYDDVPPRRGASQINAVRAAIVVAAFVVATIVLLGPATHKSAGAPLQTTTTTIHHPPQRVVKSRTTVQVANSTSAPNLASHYTQVLSTQSWATLPAADTEPGTQALAHSVVYFAPGFQLAARMVARDVGLNPNTSVTVRTANTGVANASQVDVIVVLGADLAHPG